MVIHVDLPLGGRRRVGHAHQNDLKTITVAALRRRTLEEPLIRCPGLILSAEMPRHHRLWAYRYSPPDLGELTRRGTGAALVRWCYGQHFDDPAT